MILTGRLSQEEREVHIWLDDVDRKWKAEVSIGKYISKFQKAGWVEVRRDIYKKYGENTLSTSSGRKDC